MLLIVLVCYAYFYRWDWWVCSLGGCGRLWLVICNAGWVVQRYDFVFGFVIVWFRLGFIDAWLFLMFGCIIVGKQTCLGMGFGFGYGWLCLLLWFFCLGFDLVCVCGWILI